MARKGVAGEFAAFFMARKKWWLLPIVLILALFGALMVFAHGSVLAPFIYSIF